MAFQNAYLTEEEKQMFREAKITDPSSLRGELLVPNQWTIDRCSKIALVYCGVEDREEHWKETFYLFYNSINTNQMIKLILIRNRLRLDEDRILREKYNVDGVVRWNISECVIPKKLKFVISSEKNVTELLTDMLSIYGIDGNPNDKFKIKIFLEFGNPTWAKGV